jgi:hypothetical protein
MRALGSLPWLFDNKGIRYGRAGKTPSLRGAQRRGNPEDRGQMTENSHIAARSAGNRPSSVLRLLSSGLPRAFGPRNDEAWAVMDES